MKRGTQQHNPFSVHRATFSGWGAAGAAPEMVLRLERGARPAILTQAGARPARLTQSQLKQPMNGMHDVSHAFSPSANSALGLPHF